MNLQHHLLLLLLMTFHLSFAMGGRAQRRQREAEELLKPYLGRVDPGFLCELLKCRSPVGSWCQVMKDGGVLVPKCVCPTTCPRQGAPVCSTVGKTYSNECLLHKEACRKNRRIGKSHSGTCLVSADVCSEQEIGQFPFRLLDWFLLLSRIGERYTTAPSQQCLTHTQRVELAQRRFKILDRNKDGKLSRMDLRKLHYKRMPLEHCANTFFQSCDQNRNKKVSLKEWTSCLVNRSERWFQGFMSVKMGSPKLCPAPDNQL
ncbi:SPARC-like protein 1 [Pygocentrus nattereri]|uniref:SPARC-like protein 1 n=1 Tax=Pygocentrus nattereri TaxID=42514 RepID=UPI001890B901|nr:SPARC-like protein 1 [Pygocentrus nattereri]